MHSRRFTLRTLLLALVMLLTASVSFAASVPRMTTDELNTRLGENGMAVLDVRSSYHWGASDVKIVGAKRVEPSAVAKWADSYGKEQTLVLYCA